MEAAHTRSNGGAGQWALLLAVFVIATCGLVYELVAGTLASYLLGDSVTQFSTIIGVYLFAMGIGSYLSKFVGGHLLSLFIRIELVVGLIGGFSAALLFLLFPVAFSFRVALYSVVFVTGALVGLEIPLLMRILENVVSFKELVSRVFTFDYIGALLASLLFPLVLVPQLGLIRTALFFGLCNTGVGAYLTWRFRHELPRASALGVAAALCIALQVAGFLYSERIMDYSESLTYEDRVVYATSSPYQRIVITRSPHEMRLWLNGNLQFSSADEYRYHEALVHPALTAVNAPQRVLVLGGGDGLAVREVLRYPSVRQVLLVDLDARMTELFRTQPQLVALNDSSLLRPGVTVRNEDAFLWMRQNRDVFDAVIIDFPDPSNYSIGKLYSTAFYRELKRALAPGGVVVVQSTSPYVAPQSFWCIAQTLEAVGFHTLAYHNYVPSFGEWGYVLAGAVDIRPLSAPLPPGLRYLTSEALPGMFYFSPDMVAHKLLETNKLNNGALVQYFDEEWSRYSR